MKTLTVLAVVLLGAGVAGGAAQHETDADVLEGGRVYQGSCANCHGPDGDLVAGIDLGRAQFRRALTDADLVRIIRTGIPGTPMPPSDMSEAQAMQVVSYLRSTAASRKTITAMGDVARGKSLFEGKGGCLRCHRVGVNGARTGPDLTTIGGARRAEELQRALLDPQADVLLRNRSYRVVGRDGTAITGRLVNIDTFTVQLLDAKEQLRSFQKADLREHGWAPNPLPAYRETFSDQDVADVVSYLVSLKDVVNR